MTPKTTRVMEGRNDDTHGAARGNNAPWPVRGGSPLRSISLTMVEPMAAVVAAEEPEMAAKNMPETATAWASPPVNEPTMAWAKLTRRLVTPPADMKVPGKH